MSSRPSVTLLSCALLASGCLFPSFTELTCESDCGGASTSTGGASADGGNGAGAGSNVGGDGGVGAVGGGGSAAGGAPAGGGGEGGGPPNPCADPLGRGAEGVPIDTPGRFPLYCIDSVEVSWARYLDFVNSLSFMSDAEFDGYKGPACPTTTRSVANFSSHYAYPEVFDNVTDQPLPAIGMSWCEAQIHCRWAGKELCGHIDGVSAEDPADLNTSRWVTACSHFGDWDYSYESDTYEPDTCFSASCMNDYHGLDAAAPNECEGGLPGLYNMSGNAAELTDSCVASGTPTYEDDDCQIRGGSCNLEQYTTCGFSQTIQRSAKGNYTSFRCCWTAEP